MRYAVIVPNWAPFDQELMLRLARAAEDLGFDHLFYTDHLMNPYASDGHGEGTVETWALISHVAAKTQRIRLGTAVTPISLRPPALLAKQVATVDNLSGGRIDVGIGAGWSAGSYGTIDADFSTREGRRARMREGIELIRRLWTEDRVTFEGEFYSAHDAVISPKPVQQPHPPLWIGGWRNDMLDLAAQVGNGWLPWNRSAETYAGCAKRLRSRARELGREDEISYGTAVLVLPDRMRDEPLAMARGNMPNTTPSTLAAAVEAYAAAGATVFALFPFPASDALAIVREFGRQVIDNASSVTA
jgi:probable F420-dependent oxidoreductase